MEHVQESGEDCEEALHLKHLRIYEMLIKRRGQIKEFQLSSEEKRAVLINAPRTVNLVWSLRPCGNIPFSLK